MAIANRLFLILITLITLFGCNNGRPVKAYKISLTPSLNQWDVTGKTIINIDNEKLFLKESASLYQLRVYDDEDNNLKNFAIPDLVVQSSDSIVIFIPYAVEFKTARIQMMDGSSGHYTFKKQNQLVQFSLKDESY